MYSLEAYRKQLPFVSVTRLHVQYRKLKEKKWPRRQFVKDSLGWRTFLSKRACLSRSFVNAFVFKVHFYFNDNQFESTP